MFFCTICNMWLYQLGFFLCIVIISVYVFNCSILWFPHRALLNTQVDLTCLKWSNLLGSSHCLQANIVQYTANKDWKFSPSCFHALEPLRFRKKRQKNPNKWTSREWKNNNTDYQEISWLKMELLVRSLTLVRGKLKFLKTRQAIFIYVTMLYFMFLFLQSPEVLPGAESNTYKVFQQCK